MNQQWILHFRFFSQLSFHFSIPATLSGRFWATECHLCRSATVDLCLSMQVQLHWLKILLECLCFAGHNHFRAFSVIIVTYLISSFLLFEMAPSVIWGANREYRVLVSAPRYKCILESGGRSDGAQFLWLLCVLSPRDKYLTNFKSLHVKLSRD